MKRCSCCGHKHAGVDMRCASCATKGLRPSRIGREPYPVMNKPNRVLQAQRNFEKDIILVPLVP